MPHDVNLFADVRPNRKRGRAEGPCICGLTAKGKRRIGQQGELQVVARNEPA